MTIPRAVTMFAIVAALATQVMPLDAQRGKAAAPGPRRPAASSAAAKAELKNPAALKEVAPAENRALIGTSAGPFVILVHRNWAPRARLRFNNLVKYGCFSRNHFL